VGSAIGASTSHTREFVTHLHPIRQHTTTLESISQSALTGVDVWHSVLASGTVRLGTCVQYYVSTV